MSDAYADLTPTEELFMEVLAARARTGETLWTFSTRPTIVRAAKELERLGFVFYMSGVTERTFRAGLTERGKLACLDPGYITPHDRETPAKLHEAVIKAVNGVFEGF